MGCLVLVEVDIVYVGKKSMLLLSDLNILRV